tara:strand:+ start:74 stop:262 length:189 start_codon:yes stop_codon:yes gene_type:complete
VVEEQVKIQVVQEEQEELFLHPQFQLVEQPLIVQLLAQLEQQVFQEVQQLKVVVVQIHQFFL